MSDKRSSQSMRVLLKGKRYLSYFSLSNQIIYRLCCFRYFDGSTGYIVRLFNRSCRILLVYMAYLKIGARLQIAG